MTDYLWKMDVIEVYNKVLAGHLKQFPLGFWERDSAKADSVKVIKYLIKDILELDVRDIPKEITLRLLYKYKLSGMLQIVYNTKVYDAINEAYPNRFKKWEFRVPSYYWNEDTAREAIRWLIEERLNMEPKIALDKLKFSDFRRYGLYSMLCKRYNRCIYLAVTDAYKELNN